MGQGRYCTVAKFYHFRCAFGHRKPQAWLTCFLSAGAMRGGSLGKGGCITYRRIISCVGGAFLHHCSYNHRDTVSNSAITQSAIWDLHSQQFVMCTVSNLAFTLSAFWHLHNQQFGIYTVSNLGQQLGNYRVSDLANVDGPAAALRWKDHPTVMRYAVQHIKHCLHCIPVELRASGVAD